VSNKLIINSKLYNKLPKYILETFEIVLHFYLILFQYFYFPIFFRLFERW